jgi:hypothetical protein
VRLVGAAIKRLVGPAGHAQAAAEGPAACVRVRVCHQWVRGAHACGFAACTLSGGGAKSAAHGLAGRPVEQRAIE